MKNYPRKVIFAIEKVIRSEFTKKCSIWTFFQHFTVFEKHIYFFAACSTQYAKFYVESEKHGFRVCSIRKLAFSFKKLFSQKSLYPETCLRLGLSMFVQGFSNSAGQITLGKLFLPLQMPTFELGMRKKKKMHASRW